MPQHFSDSIIPLTRVRAWIFDLDHTLYPASVSLFSQIDKRMVQYISRTLGVSGPEADRLRKDYWSRYGTTMAGLVQHHSIDAEAFLEQTHSIDFSALRPDPRLRAAIMSLSGRKIIHTNGPREYAGNVLRALGLNDLFDQVIAIEDTNLVSKPSEMAFQIAWQSMNIDPTTAAMIEDSAANLQTPHANGVETIWVPTDQQSGIETPRHVGHRTDDLTDFLQKVRSAR